eukprot:s2745_g3.t1
MEQQNKCIDMLTRLNTVDRDLQNVEELQLLQKEQVEGIRVELRRRMKVFNDLKVLLALMYLDTERKNVSFITCTQMQPQNENIQNSGNKQCGLNEAFEAKVFFGRSSLRKYFKVTGREGEEKKKKREGETRKRKGRKAEDVKRKKS